MKRFSVLFLIIAFAICMAVPALAGGRVVTDGGTASTTAGVGIPADTGSYPVMYAIGMVGLAATADLDFYEFDDTQTTFSADEAAGQTDLSVTECGGIDDADTVWLQSADGGTFEAGVASACNDTTNTMTVTATGNAYSAGDKVFEMKPLVQWDNVTTTPVYRSNDSGIIGGKRSGPLCAIGTGSGVTVYYFTGGYQ